jgi:SOUL heme-binding protein
MNPLSPAIMTVASDAPKSMSWPVAYAPPGSSSVPSAPAALSGRLDEYGGEVRVVNVPERVVAVRTFSDASVEAVVRRCDRELREVCARDGLLAINESGQGGDKSPLPLQFAQYDAVYTMGKRRGEVWIELKDGSHPWSHSR